MLIPAWPSQAGLTRKEDMLDDGRVKDIEQLSEQVRKAKNAYERDHWEGIINRIMRESGVIREAREELIEAIRTGDRRHVRYMGEKIRKLTYDRTGGRDI